MFKSKLRTAFTWLISSFLLSGLMVKETSAQMETVWQESHAEDNFPDWFSEDNYPRGGGFGFIDGDQVLVAAMRNAVRIHDAEDGSFVDLIQFEGPGGHFDINTADVTEDGKILSAALRLDVSEASFNVNMWESPEADPENVISYQYDGDDDITHRLGDQASFLGNVDDGTAMVVAANNATSDSPHIYAWGMEDGGFVDEPQVIEINRDDLNGELVNTNVAYPVGDDLWLYNGIGITPALVDGDGDVLGSAPIDVVSADSHNLKVVREDGDTFYFAVFVPNADGSEDQSYVQYIRVPDGEMADAETIDTSVSIGDRDVLANSGIVDFYFDEAAGNIDFFVMEPSNGLGRFQLETEVSAEDEIVADVPGDATLRQNYPNPFNPVTTIEFQIPSETQVTLSVFNTLGEEITTLVDDRMEHGTHQVSFDAGDLSSGVYIYRLETEDQVLINKMTVIK